MLFAQHATDLGDVAPASVDGGVVEPEAERDVAEGDEAELLWLVFRGHATTVTEGCNT